MLSMTGKILEDLNLTQDKLKTISNECKEIKGQFEIKLRTTIEELEKCLTLLQDKIYDQNRNSELSLLKSRATRTQALELKSFLKSVALLCPQKSPFNVSTCVPG